MGGINIVIVKYTEKRNTVAKKNRMYGKVTGNQ